MEEKMRLCYFNNNGNVDESSVAELLVW